MKTSRQPLFIYRMWLPIVLLLTSFLSAGGSTLKKSLADQVTPPKPPTIKVLLCKNSKGALLEVKGPFSVTNPKNGRNLSTGWKGKRFYLHPHNEGIRWGEDFPRIFQICIAPTSAETTFLLDGIQYRGTLEVYWIDGSLTMINEIDVETFLKATLPTKVSENLPNAVLDAIAMIARTDLYYTALLNHDAFYHVEAAKSSYRGIGLTKQNLPLEEAIYRTRYLVMTYRHQPFPATWTNHCAGQTANYSRVFRKNTPTPSGTTSEIAFKDRSQVKWGFICKGQEVAQLAKLNRITGIDLFADSSSNRVYGLRLRDGSHSQEIGFLDLQKALGTDRLKSNDFSVTIQGNLLSFEGYGEGVGTGLCLYTAKTLAKNGYEAPQLLETFFPNTKLDKIDRYPTTIISPNHRTFVSPSHTRRSRILPTTPPSLDKE